MSHHLISFYKDRIGNLSLARSSARNTWMQWRGSRMLQISSRTRRVLLRGSHGFIGQSYAHLQRRFDVRLLKSFLFLLYLFLYYWREHVDTKLGLRESMHREGSPTGQVHLCDQIESGKIQSIRFLSENCCRKKKRFF